MPSREGLSEADLELLEVCARNITEKRSTSALDVRQQLRDLMKEAQCAVKDVCGKQYVDDEFVADASGDASGLWRDPDTVPPDHWIDHPAAYKSFRTIYSDVQLTDDGELAANITQGGVGDCYFVATLTAINISYHSFKPSNMILAHSIDSGIYCVRFWIDGQWVLVKCDDRVPVHPSKLYPDKWVPTYAECYVPKAQSQGIYVSMLEKAYAKLHGSYESIDAGLSRFSMHDCMGGFSKSIASLQSPEVSGLTALATFDVYEGMPAEDHTQLEMLPASQFASFQGILASRAFPPKQDPKRLFLTFADGQVIGGLMAKPTEQSWYGQEYFACTGFYTCTSKWLQLQLVRQSLEARMAWHSVEDLWREVQEAQARIRELSPDDDIEWQDAETLVKPLNDMMERLLLAGFHDRCNAVFREVYHLDAVCFPADVLQLYGKAKHTKLVFEGQPALVCDEQVECLPWAACQIFVSEAEKAAFVDPFGGLWVAMKRLSDEHCTITCCMQPPAGEDVSSEEKSENGLLYMHEYTVIKLIELPDQRPGSDHAMQQIITLRNPHGATLLCAEYDPHPHAHHLTLCACCQPTASGRGRSPMATQPGGCYSSPSTQA